MAFGENTLTLLIRAKDQASQVLTKVQNNLKGHSADFERAGKRMLIASAALTAGLGVSINQAAKFQQQMAQVSTMLDATSMKHMPKFEKAIKRMSMEFGEGTATLADGLYNILSASIPAEKAIGVLDASVKAAKAGLTDTGIAADAITTIINAYGLSADKAADVSDLLFAIVKRGKLTFAELAPNIGKVAAMAAKAGLNLEGLGATIATLTRSGVRTEMAMTAVRGILNGMMKPADEAAAAFKDKLGIAMDTTTLKAEGIVGILRRMKEAGLTPEEIAKMFPNVRALTGVVAAMGDLEGITTDYNLMVNRAGLSQEAYNKNIETTQVTLKKLAAAFNIAAISLGEQLLPYVEKMAKVIIELIKWFDGLNDTYKKMVAVMTALSAAFLALAGVSALILAKIPMMITGWNLVTGAMLKSKVAALGFSSAMRFGLAASITFTALKLTELILMVPDFIRAMQNKKDAILSASELEQEAFRKTIWKLGEVREKYSQLGSEYVKQIEIIDELRENYERMGETTEYNAEATLEVQRKIIEEFKELLAMRTEADIREKKIDEEKRERSQSYSNFLASLTDAEREMFQKLTDDTVAINATEYKKKQIALLADYKLRKKTAEKELTDEATRKKYLSKLRVWYATQDAKLTEDTRKQKVTAALNIADYSIQTLQTVLEMEGSSAKKKKAMIIALITLEKGLAIARIWAAHASIPFAGTAIAAAQTALVVAQWALIMKQMTGATKGIDVATMPVAPTGVTPLPETALETEPTIDIGEGEYPTVERGTISGRETAVGGVAGQITHIHVGGVEVNLGTIDVARENLEEILRDIGEAVKSKTVEAVTMAMRIHNLGKENEGEAV